jgi:hypothetical protein
MQLLSHTGWALQKRFRGLTRAQTYVSMSALVELQDVEVIHAMDHRYIYQGSIRRDAIIRTQSFSCRF